MDKLYVNTVNKYQLLELLNNNHTCLHYLHGFVYRFEFQNKDNPDYILLTNEQFYTIKRKFLDNLPNNIKFEIEVNRNPLDEPYIEMYSIKGSFAIDNIVNKEIIDIEKSKLITLKANKETNNYFRLIV